MRLLRFLGLVSLWTVVILCLAITILPRFLDARYYRGPVSTHFDGERFFNPDGDDDLSAQPAAKGGNRGAGTVQGGMILRYILGRDGRPDWPDHVTIHPVAPPARVDGDAMLATWVGHATVLVQTGGLNILTDPVWSHTAGPFGVGPGRVTEPGIAFDKLPRIDVVLVSHDHYDHMDLATLRKLAWRDHPLIVTSLGNDSVIRQSGAWAVALDWGGRVRVTGRCVRDAQWVSAYAPSCRDAPSRAEVIVTRNHHWGTRWAADRNRTLWSSFVVRLPGGNLFFAGDTGAGDLKWADEAARYGPVRLALIPIGAFRFAPGQMAAGSHIGPIDAAEVYRRLGASRGIGIHWGTFRLSYEGYDTPSRLLAAVTKVAGERGFATVPLGVPTSIAPYRAPVPVAPIDRDAMVRRLPPAALALP